MENILEIQHLLDTLRRKDKDEQIFGANSTGGNGHHYKLNPSLTDKEITDFEKLHNIKLPDDYRHFLIHIGNGGAGPYYGINRLAESFPEDLNMFIPNFLATPFPYTEDYHPIKNEEGYSDQFWQDYESYRAVNGSLRICHYGCGYYFLLIVRGPEYGKIWFDARVSDGGILRWSSNFSSWYKGWLIESLHRIE